MTNEIGLKNRFKRIILWAGLLAILLLTGFSIYGAFIGADRARGFFNSIPMSVYWAVFTALLIAGIILFRRLANLPGLLMTHIGCVMVLVGGIWGSQAGFKLFNAAPEAETIRTGQMVLYEGTQGNTVETEQGITKTLPFAVRLVDFRMDYYEPGMLIIQTPQDQAEIPAEPGLKCMLSGDLGSVEIVRRFEHFKLVMQDGKRTAIDDPGGDPNPALELRLRSPDGRQVTRYVFERFPGHVRPEDNLQFRYQRIIRDFISDLEIIQDNKLVARKSIEVNKPLYFGGYIFYQQSYDDAAGLFTVLGVTNDRGLRIVFSGFILLCAGLFWHLWLRQLFRGRFSGIL